MRFLVRLIVIVAVIWCAWWALASWGVHRGISDVIASGKKDGWQGEVRQAGFPFRIRSDLSDLVLRDTESDVTLRTQALAVSAPAYWPGYLTVDLPQTPITVDTNFTTFTLEATEAEAGLRVHPGTSLQLESLRAQSGGWRVAAGPNAIVEGQTLDLLLNQTADDPLVYSVTLMAEDLAPGELVRLPLQLPTDWPEVFDAFDVKSRVGFDRPLDRTAGDGAPPQIRSLVLEVVDLTWGDISLRASGTLDVDETGLPDGTITVSLANWRVLLGLAEGAGFLSGSALTQAEIFMAAFANQAGSPDDLDLELNFAEGRLSSNGVPLGDGIRIRY